MYVWCGKLGPTPVFLHWAENGWEMVSEPLAVHHHDPFPSISASSVSFGFLPVILCMVPVPWPGVGCAGVSTGIYAVEIGGGC